MCRSELPACFSSGGYKFDGDVESAGLLSSSVRTAQFLGGQCVVRDFWNSPVGEDRKRHFTDLFFFKSSRKPIGGEMASESRR